MCPLLLIDQVNICMDVEQAFALIPGNFSPSCVEYGLYGTWFSMFGPWKLVGNACDQGPTLYLLNLKLLGWGPLRGGFMYLPGTNPFGSCRYSGCYTK